MALQEVIKVTCVRVLADHAQGGAGLEAHAQHAHKIGVREAGQDASLLLEVRPDVVHVGSSDWSFLKRNKQTSRPRYSHFVKT